MADIPRDPSHYSPTTHAGQQARWRDIPFTKVAEAIEEGEVRNTHEEDCWLFIRQFEGDRFPVGVVADASDGEIVTIEWRK